MPVSKRLFAIVTGAVLLCPLAAVADYRAYARGQEAAADGRWSEVEQAMQQALAGNPTPKVRVKLYGQRFAPYVPQYYLGLAAYRQNDCATALRWFGDGTAAPVMAQIPEFKGVADAARTDCNARLAANKPVPPPSTPDKPVVVAPVAERPVVPTPPSNPKPATPVVVADKPSPSPSAQTSPAVPAALQTALQHWLAGRYRNVVAGSTAGMQGKALAHLHLLRASAYLAQSDIDTSEAATLRASAERELRSARKLMATITPDAAFYSPRFRAFAAGIR